MLKTSLKSVWARKVRLFMSTFAIVLGVAFVAGSFMFTDALNKAFMGIMQGQVADVNVRPSGGATQGHGIPGGDARMLSPADVAKVQAVAGVKKAVGDISSPSAYVVDKDGKVIGGQGAPALALNYNNVPAAGGAESIKITSGRAPAKYGEIMLDEQTASRGHYVLGDTVSIMTPGDPPRYEGKLVGIMKYANGSMLGATLAAVDTSTAQKLFMNGRDGFQTIWVVADDAQGNQDALAKRVQAALPSGYEAVTGQKAAEESQNTIQKGLQFITIFLLIFAGVALIVGSFLIVNTFGMIVAQRSKELALMRALGASKRQIQTGVIIEAVVVGFVGSLLGLALGVALAHGIVALFSMVAGDMDLGEMTLAPRTVIIALVLGIGVTVMAAWLPAHRASTIAPVAAMREAGVEPASGTRGRTLSGLVLLLVGAALLTAQVITDGSIWLLVGGMLLALAGTVMVIPLVARPVADLVRAVTRRRGVVSQLAHDNTLRNPRRTAATASALTIGLTLVTMMSVFGASTRYSINKQINDQFTGDYVVAGLRGEMLSPAIAKSFDGVAGVDRIERTRVGVGSIPGGAKDLMVMGTNAKAAESSKMASGSAKLSDASVIVDEAIAKKHGLALGKSVKLTVDGQRTKNVTVTGLLKANNSAGEQAPVEFLLTLPTFESIGGTAQDSQLTIYKKADADMATVSSALKAKVKDLPTISVQTRQEFAKTQSAAVDQMLMLIYGLLALAILIASLGILNTLALSVFERTREIGLLRAIGLSRRQLRAMVRLESVTITLLGAITGIVLGLIFGVVFRRSQQDNGITHLAIPWTSVVVFLVLAIIIGVVAAWWPARRAAKLKVLDAIATE